MAEEIYDDEAFDEELLAFNGINGATGDYGIPPMTEQEFAKLLQFDIEQDVQSFPVGDGIDPADLAQTGWGIIFASNDPNVAVIKEALTPLLKLRQDQTGAPYPEKPNKAVEKYFKVFEGPDGYRPGDSKRSFLARHGVGTGPVYPENGVPYYLLLVGSPEQIPYQFQFQIGVQYAVGRIHFDTAQDYANYAHSVVAAESGAVTLPRKAALFSVENANDRATQMSGKHLIAPLSATLTEDFDDWQFDVFAKREATKGQLSQLMGGAETPALLFTASHGMEFPLGDSRQLPHQGALLCQDWPGPRRWRRPVPQDFYFAGDDLTSDANLLGLINFSFACYGGGCPRLDEFSKQSGKSRDPIAPYAFLGNLPKKMLSHPKGGALAFVGHVERAWGYSFMAAGVGSNIAMFQSAMSGLLYGDPIGYAVEDINLRFAEVATDLTNEIEDLEYFREQARQGDDSHLNKLLAEKGRFLVQLWTEHNDARDYVIIGDPAVRLPLAEEGEAAQAQARPSITVADHSAQTLIDTTAGTGAQPATTSGGTTSRSSFSTSPQDTSSEEVEKGSESFGLSNPFNRGQDENKETSPGAIQQFTERLGTFLTDALQDAGTLEITTYTSENFENIEYKDGKYTGDAELKALTRIKIDGDTDLCVPLKDGEPDGDLWAIHMEMVKQAQASRAELIKTTVTAISSLASLWKPS